jgi:hypothetical protein
VESLSIYDGDFIPRRILMLKPVDDDDDDDDIN